MKKFSRRTLALILAAVSILTIPLYAGATTYSGSIGSNVYTCTVSCAPLKVISKISCSKTSNLRTDTTVYIDYGLPYHPDADMTLIANGAKSLNHTYNVSQFLVAHPIFPSGCTFYSCTYYDYINNTNVLNGVTENSI